MNRNGSPGLLDAFAKQSYGRAGMDARCSDQDVQTAILSHLLGLHPIRLDDEELMREVVGGPEFVDRDACARAVRDLVATGLLRRDGSSVVPTRAALRFDELLR